MDEARLPLYRGKRTTFVIEFTDNFGQPIAGYDITTYAYRAMLRRDTTDATTVATFVCTVLSAYELRLTIDLPATTSLEDHVWDIEETRPGETPSIILDGVAEIREPVTR